jgi:hypothetical protein
LRVFLKYNLLAMLWGLLIILLMSMPGIVFPKVPHFLDLFAPDKLVHLFLFGVYAFLQFRGLRKQDAFPRLAKIAVTVTLASGILIGVFTELLQRYWIPLRTGSVYDLIADAAGCALGIWISRQFSNGETVKR